MNTAQVAPSWYRAALCYECFKDISGEDGPPKVRISVPAGDPLGCLRCWAMFDFKDKWGIEGTVIIDSELVDCPYRLFQPDYNERERYIFQVGNVTLKAPHLASFAHYWRETNQNRLPTEAELDWKRLVDEKRWPAIKKLIEDTPRPAQPGTKFAGTLPNMPDMFDDAEQKAREEDDRKAMAKYKELVDAPRDLPIFIGSNSPETDKILAQGADNVVPPKDYQFLDQSNKHDPDHNGIWDKLVAAATQRAFDAANKKTTKGPAAPAPPTGPTFPPAGPTVPPTGPTTGPTAPPTTTLPPIGPKGPGGKGGPGGFFGTGPPGWTWDPSVLSGAGPGVDLSGKGFDPTAPAPPGDKGTKGPGGGKGPGKKGPGGSKGPGTKGPGGGKGPMTKGPGPGTGDGTTTTKKDLPSDDSDLSDSVSDPPKP